MDVPRTWQIHPEQWRAESPVASVRYRRLPDGAVQVYWLDPKVDMTEAEAGHVAATAEAAIREAQGSHALRPVG